ncbi:MAG: sigma-70 family RNA polymerase sigma factor [Clostridiales bacterium]|nr:sigma-70 family RNA polymerase sigma factor [Clostridiales bacterium]
MNAPQNKSYKTLADEALASLAKGGDSKASAELVLRLTGVVRAQAAAFSGTLLEAEDLAQEGMFGLLSAINTYTPGGQASFKTYAGVCVRNRMADALKSASRGKHSPANLQVPIDDRQPDSNAGPEAYVISKESVENIKRFLVSGLSETESTVIRLYLGSMSYEDIAARLGITAKSVDNALQRARRKLRYFDSGG